MLEFNTQHCAVLAFLCSLAVCVFEWRYWVIKDRKESKGEESATGAGLCVVAAAYFHGHSVRLPQWELQFILTYDFIQALDDNQEALLAERNSIRVLTVVVPVSTMQRRLSESSITNWLHYLQRCDAKWMLPGAISSSR